MGDQAEVGYKIWATDDVVYGPVDMPTLVEWVRDERVVTDTWVFVCHEGKWSEAGKMSELRSVFNAITPGSVPVSHTPLVAGIKPGALRRVKILGEMSDQQLGRFAQFMEVENARQFHTIVTQGAVGDAMYLILEGNCACARWWEARKQSSSHFTPANSSATSPSSTTARARRMWWRTAPRCCSRFPH